ncbi:hypothetical protein ACU6HG_002150 [Salmonella enterica]|nr:hypothetical protein [Salmonella enterica]ELC1775875.1 hypothetical protein [Salmonella enterica]ELR6881556.1 hypothetical protein [Salmonella enterica]ELY5722236.1 hypothetical protein [Salmonella enterica]EMD9058097.1 hypothetical protein [Salmonella enterica]
MAEHTLATPEQKITDSLKYKIGELVLLELANYVTSEARLNAYKFSDAILAPLNRSVWELYVMCPDSLPRNILLSGLISLHWFMTLHRRGSGKISLKS